MSIPEELVHQFRSIALDRLDRVEAAWQTVLTSVDDASASLIHREIHTLKGESQMVGFTDVHMVCHRLEDLLELARGRGYSVDDDFDLTVNMALRFMAMLVRKKVGAQLSGIDLPGFIRQIDQILTESRAEQSGRARLGSSPIPRLVAQERVPLALRGKLGPLSVEAFIAYAQATGTRRDRLRMLWHGLRDLVGVQRAVIGPAQLAKHRDATRKLARELGKYVDLVLDVEGSELPTTVLAALDSALLHLIRNAIDHGIEAPDARLAGGKSERGRITVRGGMREGGLVFTVEDDGGGVDFDKVRARATELSLPIGANWLETLCTPGFSTRAHAGAVSGRGVGLDAVQTVVADVGGSLSATSAPRVGTTWTITIPLVPLTTTAHVFRAPGLEFPLAVEASWELEGNGAALIDLASYLGFAGAGGDARVWLGKPNEATIGLVAEREPVATQVRRLVEVSAPSPFEVILVDAVEGLLLRPERLRLG